MRRRRWIRPVLGIATLIVLLGVWQVVGLTNPTKLITPFSTTVTQMWTMVTGPDLLQDIVPSVIRALIGFVVGGAIGVTLGILLGWYRRADPWLRGVVEFGRAVPPPALVPIAFLVWGANDATRVGVIAFGTLWPVLINTLDGARRVEPGYVDAAEVYAGSRGALLLRVVLPAASPQIFAGLRIGLAISLIMMVVSEMITSPSGLGHIVVESQREFKLPQMYASILIIGILGWLLTLGFRRVEAFATRWFEGQKGLK